MPSINRNIVFVDGHCMVCHWLVNFVAKRDRDDIFRFAALQDELARSLKELNQAEVSNLSTVILLDSNKKVFYHSDAVIRILSQLPGSWSYTRILLFFPKFIRDTMYKMFTRIRYAFGRKKQCSIPSKEIRSKLK